MLLVCYYSYAKVLAMLNQEDMFKACLAIGGCLANQWHVSTGECGKSDQPQWQTRDAVWRESKPCILAAKR